MDASAERVFSVGQLSASIRKNLLANNERIRTAWFEGEISGWKPYPSGHFYFTLKDDAAQISAVLFSFHAAGCSEEFAAAMRSGAGGVDGLKVQVQGALDLSMKQGRYSFKVFRIRLAGLGEKMAAFKALRDRLEREGLNKLDHPEKRRALPFLPHRIGIVTSPAGAVIHDMCTVLVRRFPDIAIRLYPIRVQGDGAARDVAEGLAYFNALAQDPAADWRPDLVIVGRGGGSAEDLWCFNEETAVMAVARSAVPVISAVGHESDTTLCDYAADLRAGTPSIAAERAVPVKADLERRLATLAERLRRAPMVRVEGWSHDLDYLAMRLCQAPKTKCADFQGRLDRVALRLTPALREAIAFADHRMERATMRLKLLNPENVMQRGYAIAFDENGRVVTSVAGLRPGGLLRTRVSDGTVTSRIEAFGLPA